MKIGSGQMFWDLTIPFYKVLINECFSSCRCGWELFLGLAVKGQILSQVTQRTESWWGLLLGGRRSRNCPVG